MAARLAFVVSHPVQYYTPLYQRLAERPDIDVKVFFTRHAGEAAVWDEGFQREIQWDIPLTEGYAHQRCERAGDILAWRPDAVHVTGWASLSHLRLMRTLRRRGVPSLFRGDSHLLDEDFSSPRWLMKRALLTRVFAWPSSFLTVGTLNRAYYAAFGVGGNRVVDCPHCIDVSRFRDPHGRHEAQARRWRERLGISPGQQVVLFAGKFDRNKNPLLLMQAVRQLGRDLVLVLAGDGELRPEMQAIADAEPERFRLLPFQNQSVMPVVYRLGDLFVMPSHRETWGLAANEALACGRPVLVSDGAGCAPDLITPDRGRIFRRGDENALASSIAALLADRSALAKMGENVAASAAQFDVAQTEAALIGALEKCR